MPDDNRISVEISAEDKTAILEAIATIRAKLPFLINLSPADRIALPKMSDKSLAFDEKAAGYMTTLPEFVPGYVDVAEVAKDRALREALADVARELSALASSMEDTQMVIASEIWMADLGYYQSVRLGAKRGIAGAKVAYDDLRTRFPGGTRTKAAPATPPA